MMNATVGTTRPRDSEQPLSRAQAAYILMLARQAPFSLVFRTGAGRIYRDLLIHWPTLDHWENEAQEICAHISDAVYPLVSSLFAQAIEMTVTLSSKPIAPLTHIEGMSTYVIFDAEQGTERHYFLSPSQPLPPPEELSVPQGLTVLCRPLHYRYHTLKDDRKRTGHPHAGIFELSERLLNALLDAPAFITSEKKILMALKGQVVELPETIRKAEISRQVNLADAPRHMPRPAPTIATITSLSALPPAVRALERKVMSYAMNRDHSPELRVGLRRVAQSLRAHYPQAMLEEASLAQTQRLANRPAVAPPAPAVAPVIAPIPAAAPRAAAVVAAAVTAPAPQQGQAFAPMAQPLSVRPSVLEPTQTPSGEPAPEAAERRAEPRRAQEPQARQEQQPARRSEQQAQERPQQEPGRPEKRQQPRDEDVRRAEPAPQPARQRWNGQERRQRPRQLRQASPRATTQDLAHMPHAFSREGGLVPALTIRDAQKAANLETRHLKFLPLVSAPTSRQAARPYVFSPVHGQEAWALAHKPNDRKPLPKDSIVQDITAVGKLHKDVRFNPTPTPAVAGARPHPKTVFPSLSPSPFPHVMSFLGK